jgi:hypothetical protein
MVVGLMETFVHTRFFLPAATSGVGQGGRGLQGAHHF